MPTNRYVCVCGKEWSYIGPYKDRSCPSCEAQVKPCLPSEISSPAVLETVDKGRNVKWRDNFKERAEKRNKFYNKKEAKERARVHGDDPAQHGITEDDAKMI